MYAVVGAGYGDEGKGLVTDYLAAQNPGATVIRTNGGAQAAHTVQLADGKRHVFHHFGSGTLAGAKTHLSRDMIVNPIMFRTEHQELGCPRISVSPDALVTIPQDMLLNQMKETERGDARHGSCGMGIHETMVRSEKWAMPLTIGTLVGMEPQEIRDKLDSFRAILPWHLPEPWATHLYDSDILWSYILDVRYMFGCVDIIEDEKVDVNLAIFEAAQGLGLDQFGEDFPYVTHSSTGVNNMCKFANDAPMTAYYVTRCYVTRHGAGPLVHEGKLKGVEIVDPTNQPNEWQGTLRNAPLDLDVLKRRIDRDLADRDENVTAKLVITCLDQVKDWGEFTFYMNNVEWGANEKAFIQIVEDYVGIKVALVSHGPTRENITCNM